MNKRNMYFDKPQLRAESVENQNVIEGYFATYDNPTRLGQGKYESISPGAFERSIKENDIRCLFNHNKDVILGRSGNGTLELKSDDKGLYGKVFINERDAQAMDIYERVKRGDINGCSFGFLPVEERAERFEDGMIHKVRDAHTVEVSIVTFPQYSDTEIHARSQQFEEYNKNQFDERKQKLMFRLKGENK